MANNVRQKMLQYLKTHQVMATVIAALFILAIASAISFLVHKNIQPAKAVKSSSGQTAVAQSDSTQQAGQTSSGGTATNQSSSSVSVTSTNGNTQVTQTTTSSSSYDGHEMNPQNTYSPTLGPAGIKGHIYKFESFNGCPNGGPGVTCQVPLQKTVKVLDGDGNLVKTVNSDSNGYFETDLAPGPYILVPQSCDPNICYAPPSQSITVQKVGYTNVTFVYSDMMSTN